MHDLPERIELSRGTILEISREVTVEVGGEWLRSVFQENTIATKLTHAEAGVIVIVFPRGYLGTEFSRNDIIFTSLFHAGVAYGTGKSVVAV